MLNTGIPLMKNAKSVLAPLGLTVAASSTMLEYIKKILGSGTTTPIISNYKMENIIKIVNFFEDPGLVSKGVSKTIKNESKEK